MIPYLYRPTEKVVHLYQFLPERGISSVADIYISSVLEDLINSLFLSNSSEYFAQIDVFFNLWFDLLAVQYQSL